MNKELEKLISHTEELERAENKDYSLLVKKYTEIIEHNHLKP